MKKLLTLLMAISLLLCLCACNTQPAKDNGGATSTTAIAVTTATTTINMGLSLQEAFDMAVRKHTESPTNYRLIGELQPETQEIINIDGQFYQSYVASNADIRYVWLSNSELPEPKGDALWDWASIGTASEYSLELLGIVDEGRN